MKGNLCVARAILVLERLYGRIILDGRSYIKVGGAT